MIDGLVIRLDHGDEHIATTHTEGSEMHHGSATIDVRDGDVIEFTHRGERRTAEVMIRDQDDQVLLDLFDGDRPAFAQLSGLVDLAVFRPDASGLSVAA